MLEGIFREVCTTVKPTGDYSLGASGLGGPPVYQGPKQVLPNQRLKTTRTIKKFLYKFRIGKPNWGVSKRQKRAIKNKLKGVHGAEF